ncbi:MAG: MFS transporter [Caulobacterales bacterium]|nr:MFS transporter [Caulobacterales bacterium]
MAEAATASEPRMSRRRWVICGLLFTAVVINYVDRQMLGVLKPAMSKELGWSEQNYADIVFYFQAAYALSYLAFGAIVDRVGAKIGYGVAFLLWQLAHIAHGFASGLGSFFAVRVALGIGEGGNFPGGIKAVTDWFPKKERALATGIFNAGSNIGAVITPIIAPAIMVLWGWQAAFIATGVVGMLWLVAWVVVYKNPRDDKKVNAAELAHIEQDPADTEKKVGWLVVLGKKETWAYAIGKFLIDPVWWMLLFWLPDFFNKTFELKTTDILYMTALAVVYLISDVGSVGGGWMSSRFMKMGWSINRARKMTMLVLAVCALPYLLVTHVHNLWGAILIVGWLAAVHQAFSANLYTLPGDVFPRKAVGSVIGIGGMVGGIGGMIMAKGVGKALSTTLGYPAIFAVCAFIYLAAILAVHLLSPKMELVEV